MTKFDCCCCCLFTFMVAAVGVIILICNQLDSTLYFFHYDSGFLRGNQYSMEDVYLEIGRKFQNAKIHVNTLDTVPKYVWYQEANEESVQEEFKYELLGSWLPLEGISVQQPVHFTKEAYLEFANTHIDFMAQGLLLQRNPRSWIKIPVQENQNLKSHALLQHLGLRYEDAVAEKFVGCSRLGFLRHMHDSAGRNAVEALLKFAGKIAFGPDFPANTDREIIFSFGTSPYGAEGFPVVLAPIPEDDTSQDLSSLDSASDVQFNEPFEHVRKAASRQAREKSNTGSSLSERKSYVFSDLLVTSVDASGWLKILLLCEVKSGYGEFKQSDIAQLVRQMIAVCMFQTEVFGLLINAGHAKLVSLEHDPVNKELIYFELPFKNTYAFFNPRRTSDAFLGESLKTLLADLVKVFEYGKEKIFPIRSINKNHSAWIIK